MREDILSVTVIKTRYHSRLEIDAALRLAVTSLEPNLHILMSNKRNNHHTKNG